MSEMGKEKSEDHKRACLFIQDPRVLGRARERGRETRPVLDCFLAGSASNMGKCYQMKLTAPYPPEYFYLWSYMMTKYYLLVCCIRKLFNPSKLLCT